MLAIKIKLTDFWRFFVKLPIFKAKEKLKKYRSAHKKIENSCSNSFFEVVEPENYMRFNVAQNPMALPNLAS